MALVDDLRTFAKTWKDAEAIVKARRDAWERFATTDMRPRIASFVEHLAAGGVQSYPMDDRELGCRRVGLRLDTRDTGLTIEKGEAKKAVDETFADLAFQQQPSGLVWVLGWQPYIPELVVDTPNIWLFRDFDPIAGRGALDLEALSKDIMTFLRWAFEHSYRGAKMIHGPRAVEIEGFKPFAG